MKAELCTQLSKHVYHLILPTNIGVIALDSTKGETPVYLIDSGNDDSTAQILLDFLNEKFTNPKLCAVINTHSHADHCGANKFLKEKTGCQIWASRGEGAMMEFPQIETSLIWGGNALKDIRTKYFVAASCHADKKFLNNAVLQAGDLKIESIPLPGHYLDQTGFIVHDTDGISSAFLGDAISGRNILKKYWIQYLLDEQTMKDSLVKISKLKADFYIPGHGQAVTEIEGLAELNILALLETENLILEELSSPKTTEQILKAVAERNDLQMKLSQYVLIGSTVRAYLTSLYDAEKITYQIKDNTFYWSKI
ncbi:MAG TPA: hypothetical protein DCF70_06160 [Treponema sp.]|nr:hypothetical protein [Treponema sp.]